MKTIVCAFLGCVCVRVWARLTFNGPVDMLFFLAGRRVLCKSVKQKERMFVCVCVCVQNNRKYKNAGFININSPLLYGIKFLSKNRKKLEMSRVQRKLYGAEMKAKNSLTKERIATDRWRLRWFVNHVKASSTLGRALHYRCFGISGRGELQFKKLSVRYRQIRFLMIELRRKKNVKNATHLKDLKRPSWKTRRTYLTIKRVRNERMRLNGETNGVVMVHECVNDQSVADQMQFFFC